MAFCPCILWPPPGRILLNSSTVEVHQLTRSLVLVATDRSSGGSVQVVEPAEVMADKDPVHGRGVAAKSYRDGMGPALICTPRRTIRSSVASSVRAGLRSGRPERSQSPSRPSSC